MLLFARTVLDAKMVKKGPLSPADSKPSGGAEQETKGPLLQLCTPCMGNESGKQSIYIYTQPLLGNF